MSERRESRPRWLTQRTALRVALLGLVLTALVLPASGQTKSASPNACQLEIFSWWTGGGEAVFHSRPVERQGLVPAFLPCLSDHTR